MHELMELKDKLCEELEKYAKKDMTASNLEYIDKLAHAAKNVDKLLEASTYSEMRGGYSRGNLAANRGMSYDGTMYHDGMSYARGRGADAQRDARGRYSSGSMLDELRHLREDAPTEQARQEFDRFIRKMETMG